MSPLRKTRSDRRWKRTPGTGLILPRYPSRERFIEPRGTAQCCCDGGNGWPETCQSFLASSVDAVGAGETNGACTCTGMNATWETLVALGGDSGTDDNDVAWCVSYYSDNGSLVDYNIFVAIYASLEAQTRSIFARTKRVACGSCPGSVAVVDHAADGYSSPISDVTDWSAADGPYGWDGAGSIELAATGGCGCGNTGTVTVDWNA